MNTLMGLYKAHNRVFANITYHLASVSPPVLQHGTLNGGNWVLANQFIFINMEGFCY